MKNRKLAIIAAVIGVGVLLTAGSCDTGKAAQPYQDADVADVNKGPADQITMPDGFSNAATKCDHGNRLYVLFHADAAYGGIAVVPNDPTCA